MPPPRTIVSKTILNPLVGGAISKSREREMAKNPHIESGRQLAEKRAPTPCATSFAAIMASRVSIHRPRTGSQLPSRPSRQDRIDQIFDPLRRMAEVRVHYNEDLAGAARAPAMIAAAKPGASGSCSISRMG